MESVYVKLAKKAIEEYLVNGKKISCCKLIDELERKKACFVSIHLLNGDLRGCIGTILPVQENLCEEIINNAISAATRDPRFKPINKVELEHLKISVDVLSELEKVDGYEQLDQKKYGVLVEAGAYKRGVLLPDLEGVDSVEEQVKIAKMKGGIGEGEEFVIYRFQVERHY